MYWRHKRDLEILDYHKLIDISEVSDDVLELWYGKIGIRFLELVKNCTMGWYNPGAIQEIHYFLGSSYVLKFYINISSIIISYHKVWKVLMKEFNIKTDSELHDILKNIFSKCFKFEIKSIRYNTNF